MGRYPENKGEEKRETGFDGRSHMGVITLKGDVKVCGFNEKYVCWGNG